MTMSLEKSGTDWTSVSPYHERWSGFFPPIVLKIFRESLFTFSRTFLSLVAANFSDVVWTCLKVELALLKSLNTSPLFYSAFVKLWNLPLYSKLSFLLNFLNIFFWRAECVRHSFASVAHFVFLRDVLIRTQRAAVASSRATSLATHISLTLLICTIW